MATLRAVKKRIRTVVSTRRITKAMEMVAAAKLRKATQRVEQAKPYAKKMDEMLSHLASAATGEIIHPYFEDRPIKRKTLVVITSDRGLCGSFNTNVLRKAEQWLAEQKDCEVELVTIGKRGNDYYKRRRWPIVKFFGDWGGVPNYDRTREIMTLLTSRFVTGQTDQITLVYTRFLSMVRYHVVGEPYLPIAKPALKEGEQVGEYIFEPTPEEIYSSLMPGYATTKLVTAMVESFASEHGSRMIAMGGATKNAGEMIDTLTLDYNKARQAQITKEILEVVSGAEALKG
ncbi:ATP synthase F1 subunit gamma [candidate division GN15 bacterium]|uniref:ATP synthase gamma chain n=1 Tax=candidate division GN15 bacterium TaxID=2072418 RepID=A0A855X2U7_9BACT|nr:MAG: ATP synthase F1 subunit gamma [candidate division GN15 bacterium]